MRGEEIHAARLDLAVHVTLLLINSLEISFGWVVVMEAHIAVCVLRADWTEPDSTDIFS